MLFIIIIAIALIGLLTVAIQHSSRPEGANIDKESLAIKTSDLQRYGGELERAVGFILQNGKSESDIRFAHPKAPKEYGELSGSDLTAQVFDRKGGGASYREAPAGINDGSSWEFFGGTHLPGVGSNRPELMAILPNVTKQFCDKVNRLNGQSGQPVDTGSGSASNFSAGECVNLGKNGRFSNNAQFYDPPTRSPNTVNEDSFDEDPTTEEPLAPLQGCIQCTKDGQYHFYHVIMAR